MGIRVFVGHDEPIGQAMRRLKQLMDRHGVSREVRRHREFIKPTVIRRAKEFRQWFHARMATIHAEQLEEPAMKSNELIVSHGKIE